MKVGIIKFNLIFYFCIKQNNMKKILLVAIACFISQVGFSGPGNWAELKSFHEVMSQTFHPSEEGNLVPIKERSGEMVVKAEALQNSKIPAEFANEKIQASIKQLVIGSKELNVMIDKKAPDADITSKLSAVHDTFHEIVGLCSKEDKHHENKGDAPTENKIQPDKKSE
jgi:hypothetical protein